MPVLDKATDRNAMSFSQLLSWAWEETPPVHKRTANLLIHLFAVPLFVIGHVRRLYSEQFFNFWRFLFSGKWYASLRSPSDA